MSRPGSLHSFQNRPRIQSMRDPATDRLSAEQPMGANYPMAGVGGNFSPQFSSQCVTVQQPPKLITRRKVIFVKKFVQEPIVTNNVRRVMVPIVSTEDRVVNEPKLIWETQIKRIPKVCWSTRKVLEPYLQNRPRVIEEQREVCQPVVYLPKPQVVPVPPPQEFCVYATGPSSLRFPPSRHYQCPPCPPCRPLNFFNPCDPRNCPFVPVGPC